jgi:hypothetical protein
VRQPRNEGEGDRRRVRRFGPRAAEGGEPGLPNAAFYCTALKVLNPSLKEEYDGFTQLDWYWRRRFHMTMKFSESSRKAS